MHAQVARLRCAWGWVFKGVCAGASLWSLRARAALVTPLHALLAQLDPPSEPVPVHTHTRTHTRKNTCMHPPPITCTHLCMHKSHSLMVPSAAPDSSTLPSVCSSRERTLSVCPRNFPICRLWAGGRAGCRMGESSSLGRVGEGSSMSRVGESSSPGREHASRHQWGGEAGWGRTCWLWVLREDTQHTHTHTHTHIHTHAAAAGEQQQLASHGHLAKGTTARMMKSDSR